MYEVLRKWEHLVAHIGRCAAAAEVRNLIEFVHRSAGFRQNRTAAGDKAPSVQITAVLDCNGAVIRHFDVSIITNGTSLLTATSCKISAAQTDRAIDGNGRAFAHRQRPERLRRGSRPNRRRSIRIQCPCRVEGDQQRDSRRNGIVAADGAISSQGNLGLAVCLRIGDRIVQVVEHLTAGLKERQLLADEPRRDGTVTVKVQSGFGIGADALSAVHIVPALEAVALRWGRLQLIGRHGALRVAIFLGNEFSVYCISAVFSRHESRSCIDIAYQNHVGKGDHGVGAGAARFDLHLNGGAGFKLLAEAAVCGGRGVVHQNRTFAYLDGIVKGQRRLCGLLVGDGQRRTIVTATAAA